MKHAILLAVTCAVACSVRAQDPPAPPKTATSQDGPASQPSVAQKIDWPADEKRVVCVVDGAKMTAGDLVDHLERRHWPGLRKFLELPAGRLYFETPLIARWVRQFADINALMREAEQRGVDRAAAELAIEGSLKMGFESWLDRYTEDRTKQGITAELTQETVNQLLERFQNEFGLECELGGWLGALAPPTPLEAAGVLRDYYAEYPQFFGGRVTVSHILVRDRDARTGELLVGAARRAAMAKLADIEARLLPDGSNFEDVAHVLSDDRITAGEGGMLHNIQRFDPLMPAVLCRRAWEAVDGQVVGPFESPYGQHFLKRLSYTQATYAIYTDTLNPEVARIKSLHERENVLFEVRAKRRVELKY